MNKSKIYFFTFLLLLLMAENLRAQCSTFAGNIQAYDYFQCKHNPNSVLISVSTGSIVLEPNDTWALVIHNGATPNEIGTIMYSTVNNYIIMDDIEVGTYRIAAIAGNSLGSAGVVDLNDPCLSVSNAGTLTISPQPQINYIGDPTTPLGCENQTLALTAEIIGAVLFPPMQFTWRQEGEIISNTADVTIDKAKDVYLRVQNGTCVVYDTLELTGEYVDIEFNPICGGGLVQRQLNTLTVGATAPFAYNWSNGATTSSIEVGAEAATFSVTVTDATGCQLFDDIEVPAMVASAPAELVYDDIPGFCVDTLQGLRVVFPTEQFPDHYWLHTYAWSTGDNDYYYIFPETPGTYSLTVTNITNGCSQVRSYVVEEYGCAQVSGQVYADFNNNCVFDEGDQPLANYIIIGVLLGSTVQVYAVTDENGNYSFDLEVGTYSFSVQLPNDLWNPCQGTFTETIAQGGNYSFEFPLQPLTACPAMEIDLSAPFLRRCIGEGTYYICYSNEGTVSAQNAYIELALDDFLNYVSSSLPAVSLGDNVYRFDLGDVPVNGSGYFYVNVQVSCEAELGQSHCTEATIFPNEPCPTPAEWSGAQVEITATCGTELVFQIKNIGSADMTVPLDYVVIEDAIMKMWPPNPTTLPAGGVMPITVPANGATWRLETNQEPFSPGSSHPTLVVEGCTTNGEFTTGFVNQLTLNDEPWRDRECVENVGSYDPNDKQGIPVGYGAEHYIRRGDEIEYLIRFQNTGTDTAFTVVIRDTLSQHFDFTSFRAGASSHPYRVESYGVGPNVKFVFDNINLPDSSDNQAGSNGFVSYRIRQKANLPIGTDLLNRAAIYFDFNEPILTNTTQHRIGENFLQVVSTWTAAAANLSIQVSPNPAADVAFINIIGYSERNADWQIDWVDALGRVVRSEQATSSPIRIQRGDLPAGTYAVRITDATQQLHGLVKLNIR
jgi:uncharacterized repeat protein (TIGR01451 family)